MSYNNREKKNFLRVVGEVLTCRSSGKVCLSLNFGYFRDPLLVLQMNHQNIMAMEDVFLKISIRELSLWNMS